MVTTVRALISWISLSWSTGEGSFAIQPPATSTWFITLRLKITALAMPARLALPVAAAAPSISGVMMLLFCARMVTEAS